jgi:hypothetical protein
VLFDSEEEREEFMTMLDNQMGVALGMIDWFLDRLESNGLHDKIAEAHMKYVQSLEKAGFTRGEAIEIASRQNPLSNISANK